mgnify:CR=1 FL=1
MKDSCKEAYRKLGESKAPNVLTKVILAFLLPLILFILSIAAFERLLTDDKLKTEMTAELGAFAGGIAVVFVYLIILNFFLKRSRSN